MISNIFFEEVEDSNESETKKIDDKLVDLTDKVDVEEKRQSETVQKKATKKVTKKVVQKKATKKSTKKNTATKKKPHQKLYADLDDNSNKEVINLYDE